MKDFDVAGAPLDQQVLALEAALATNPVVSAIFQRVPRLGLADWYLARVA